MPWPLASTAQRLGLIRILASAESVWQFVPFLLYKHNKRLYTCWIYVFKHIDFSDKIKRFFVQPFYTFKQLFMLSLQIFPMYNPLIMWNSVSKNANFVKNILKAFYASQFCRTFWQASFYYVALKFCLRISCGQKRCPKSKCKLCNYSVVSCSFSFFGNLFFASVTFALLLLSKGSTSYQSSFPAKLHKASSILFLSVISKTFKTV